MEFYRHSMALLPDLNDADPGTAIMVLNTKYGTYGRSCNCLLSKTKTCHHVRTLTNIYKATIKTLEGKTLDKDFTSSIWLNIANVLSQGSSVPLQSIQIKNGSSKKKKSIQVFDSKGNKICSYISKGQDRLRFIERCIDGSNDSFQHKRKKNLDTLSLLTLSDSERQMALLGAKTRQQVFEESFFFRLAYHAYRESGTLGSIFKPVITRTSGAFNLVCISKEKKIIYSLNIPRQQVVKLFEVFHKYSSKHHLFSTHNICFKTVFKTTITEKGDIKLKPYINSGAEFYERKKLEKYIYKTLIYLEKEKLFSVLKPVQILEKKFNTSQDIIIKKSEASSFWEIHGGNLFQNGSLISKNYKKFKVFQHTDNIKLNVHSTDSSWYSISAEYKIGSGSISLAEILKAKKNKQRFVIADNGWVDLKSSEFRGLDTLTGLSRATSKKTKHDKKNGKLLFSRTDLFRLRAALTYSKNDKIDITGNKNAVKSLKNIFEMKPAKNLPKMSQMKSSLRKYQTVGTKWIIYLYENGLGGLLCDDMGLGKTHQIMAFILFLRKYEKVKEPFLVICPTTILSHWKNILNKHAPSLKISIFHGINRNLKESMNDCDILLSSYGILRVDIDKLEQISFTAAVFDEIHYLKNPETISHKAAVKIKASVKIGLTGTPIENTAFELKALMDLTVPGYLGTDNKFKARYVNYTNASDANAKHIELNMLISPFILRRLKSSVLNELPMKIEDVRICRLSCDQIKLYQDTIKSQKGKNLLATLKNDKKPVPMMHIFAFLTHLKKICNHPAMLTSPDDYAKYKSGKWELFQELIIQALSSGQKIVVYSQFVIMLRIIEKWFDEQDIQYVTLTGATRNREKVINRFNNDEKCRVFAGSLKAGGIGIDLMAGSVVIHYDRWWNSAKEDQATDRVHRIGQKRGVQVFKLVTKGTLEEKIADIIEKKKNLSENIIKEDDPNLLKVFSKNQLLEMLSI